MRNVLLTAITLMATMVASAAVKEVKSMKYAGPFVINRPVMLDSLDNKGKRFDNKRIIDNIISLDNLERGVELTDSMMPAAEREALHLVGFEIENKRQSEVEFVVDTELEYKLIVDNKPSGGDESLEPGTHRVVIKYVTTSDEEKAMHVSVAGDVEIRTDGKRMYTIYDVITAKTINRVAVSPNGKYMIVSYRETDRNGDKKNTTRVAETATGKTLLETDKYISWMPLSNRYYYTERKWDGSQSVVAVDPATNEKSVIAKGLRGALAFRVASGEKYLVGIARDEGIAKDDEVYEIKSPEDRQQGARDKTYLVKADMSTGIVERLVNTRENMTMFDVSADGRKVLMGVTRERLEKRPTTVMDIYVMDMETRQMEKIVDSDGHLSMAMFSPDAKEIVMCGGPEGLGGIGKNVDEGQTPSMVDEQLYIMDLPTRSVRAVTKDFNPSVKDFTWSESDGKIYFTAENKDKVSLYRLDPKSGKIEQISVPEDIVKYFDVASGAQVMVWAGQSASNSDRLYVLNTKNKKSTVVEDLSKVNLKNVALGDCREWNFVNEGGDTICGRYYLPADFDSSKKYPMIVNYYGGCSPISRNLESRYPHHAYAALGYVVYVVEPSGATGFGQKFSARHVNTAGEGPAQDIIEGVKKFCEEHAFVDSKKVGCIGASYGGFMTQYLQTKTDIFAAAISHAGISDHTSYWGEGYWGYSYSEVSMANRYPWTDKELYVDRSPLYNADKIHTPILFVHGTSDVNVPIGESIQMFTALKLLGRETAFVAVEGEDHHILDYGKRIKWQNTIYAWFAKWLQDDPTWWEEMYGK